MTVRGETEWRRQAHGMAEPDGVYPIRRRWLAAALIVGGVSWLPMLTLGSVANAQAPSPDRPPSLPLPPPPRLPVAVTGQIARVLSGDRLLLSDGTALRLADLEAPWQPPPGSDDLPWPLAEAARSRLADRILGASVAVRTPSLLTDRWGYLPGHLVLTATGVWLNAEIVAEGWGRVVPATGSDLATVRTLQALEQTARTAGRGLWAEPFYRVQTPAELPFGLPGYRLFEGRILDTALVGERIYLNFGADWRTDTTLVLDAALESAFIAAGLPPLQLAGRLVRVRGYVTDFNGPQVTLVHPGQIELLDPP